LHGHTGPGLPLPDRLARDRPAIVLAPVERDEQDGVLRRGDRIVVLVPAGLVLRQLVEDHARGRELEQAAALVHRDEVAVGSARDAEGQVDRAVVPDHAAAPIDGDVAGEPALRVQVEQHQWGIGRASGRERDGREIGRQGTGRELASERRPGIAIGGDRARLVLVRAAGAEPGQRNDLGVGGPVAADAKPRRAGGPVLDLDGGRRVEPQVQGAEDRSAGLDHLRAQDARAGLAPAFDGGVARRAQRQQRERERERVSGRHGARVDPASGRGEGWRVHTGLPVEGPERDTLWERPSPAAADSSTPGPPGARPLHDPPMNVVQVGLVLDTERREPAALLDVWPTLGDVACAANADGVSVTVVQAAHRDALIERGGVTFHFVSGDSTRTVMRRVVARAVELRPEVLHVQGLSFPIHTNVLTRAFPHVPILVQDHGSRPPVWWKRPLHRWGLAGIAGVAFTAREQAAPFVAAGVLRPDLPVLEVLESSSWLTPGDRDAARRATGLYGEPCLAWVGRLDANKDPLT